jgi:hypothetical protein
MGFETRVIDNMAEGPCSEPAGADMGVAIDSGTEAGFGVVEMERLY